MPIKYKKINLLISFHTVVSEGLERKHFIHLKWSNHLRESNLIDLNNSQSSWNKNTIWWLIFYYLPSLCCQNTTKHFNCSKNLVFSLMWKINTLSNYDQDQKRWLFVHNSLAVYYNLIIVMLSIHKILQLFFKMVFHKNFFASWHKIVRLTDQTE